MNSAPSSAETLSPFHGDGPSWKRNLLFGVLAVVLVGGSISYLFKGQFWSRPDTVTHDTVATEQQSTDTPQIMDSDLYGSYDEASASDDFDVQASTTTEGYMTFTDYHYGFQIDYPQEWTLSPAYDYTSFSSDYEGDVDYLLENFNIGIEDLSSYGYSMSLDDYEDAALDQLLSEPAYTFLEQRPHNMGKYEGRLLVGLYDFGGETSLFSLGQTEGRSAGVKSFFIVYENTAYVLTYMYELPEKEVYSTLMDHVLKSFKILRMESSLKQPNAEVDDQELGFTSVLHLDGRW